MFRRGKLPFVSTKDDRIKIFNERVNATEKHILDIASLYADCARRTAKYRDSYDELAKSVKSYADDEEINANLSEGLKSFASALTILGDYMDIHVHRIELKIVNELAQFEGACKSTKDTLRSAIIARDKEVLKQRQMIEIKSKFAANNTAADSELLKSKLEVNRTNKEIDEVITNFEKRKLDELKATLTNFILISIKYHTKSLEALTASYYDISNIDERGDLLAFQKLMKTKDEQSQSARKAALKKGLRSQSMESLDRDQLLSPIKKVSRVSRSTKNLTDKSDDDLEANEDDEDIEEEDESEENSNEDEESASLSEDEAEDLASDSQSEAKPIEKSALKKSTKQHFKVQQVSGSNAPRQPKARQFQM